MILRFKICSKCKIEKTTAEFFKRPNRKSGLGSQCKDCVMSKNRENKEHINKKARERNEKKSLLAYKIAEHLKLCSKCKEEKLKTDFYKNAGRHDGIHHTCKSCVKVINHENKDKLTEYNKKWELKNKVKRREQKRLIQKKWIANNPNYNKEYIAKRKDLDDVYRLGFRVRNLIRKAIIRRGYSKSKKTEAILGCSIAEFSKYIENLFTDGMCWERIAEIHLDHKIPMSSAQTEADVIRLNHYTNLQPLWAEDNLKKGAKFFTANVDKKP